MYLDFLNSEVSFNDGAGLTGRDDECYGSIPLWAIPYEGDIEDFSREEMFINLPDGEMRHLK